MSRSDLLVAVARPLLPRFPALSAGERATVEGELGDFLAAEVEAMPRHLHLAFCAALACFSVLPLLRWGRTYAALPPESRERVVRAWSAAPFGPPRDFVKLVRSLTLFFYLDHPLVVARLETQSEDAEASRAG